VGRGPPLMAPKKGTPAPKAGGPGTPAPPVAQQMQPPPAPPAPPVAAAPAALPEQPGTIVPAKPGAAANGASKKKKVGPKMPGAKTGFPIRLAEQLRDYFVIGTILAGIAVLGNMKAEVAAAHGHGGHDEEGHGEESHGEESHGEVGHGEVGHGEVGHGEEGHGDEHGHHKVLLTLAEQAARRALSGHAVDPALDLQVTLGICVVLITVTIIFEIGKHKLEHNVPPMMAKILEAMWGELTVLGFIALWAYFAIKFGLIEWASLKIYHDPEHLLHLFEDIHFMLFFVMLIFLFQACILVLATLRAEEFFQRTESLIANAPALEKASPAEAAAAPAVSQMLATYKAARANCCTRICICPRLLWGYREAEAKEELTYALLRARFVFPPKTEKNAAFTKLPAEFDFSTYLRLRCVHEVAHTLHVSENTWAAVIVFLGLILYVPVLEEKYAHVNITVQYVIGLGWALWLYSFAVRAKMGHVMYMLTPPHALLDGPPKEFDEEAPTVALLAQKTDTPPYENLAPTAGGSKHERLFWRGRQGPGHLLFLMRFQMLLTAICLAVMYTWLNSKPEDTYALLLGLLPVLDVMITSPKSILPMMVLTTSCELMKKKADVEETINEMKTEKTLKMLKMLNTLSAQAKKAQKLQKMDKKQRPGMPKPKPRDIDPVVEAELRQAFDLFDKDSSGTIDKDELRMVMQSLGQDLDDGALATLYAVMDPDGSGTIDFGEFCDVMAPDPTPETPAQIAASVFLMLDKDGSGKITAAELKDSVRMINPTVTDEDIAAAMELFDKDRTGTVTEKEFRQGIELMKTFG